MATDEPLMAGVAGRYASALFELASETGKVAAVEQDLTSIQGMIDSSDDFRRFVRSPLISADDQMKALDALLTRAGVGDLVRNFMKLIASNRRLFAASDMIKAFRALAARARGEVAAEVISAHTLNNEQTAALKESLKAAVGKDVALAVKVDPSLLGGLIVKIGSRMIDSSLKTRLTNMRQVLKGST